MTHPIKTKYLVSPQKMAAAAALEASPSFFLPSPHLHSSTRFLALCFTVRISNSTHLNSYKFPLIAVSTTPKNYPLAKTTKRSQLYSSPSQETTLETETEKTQQGNKKRKLFVVSLPWSFTVTDIKDLFGQCGTVEDVEIIKQKDGRSRSFAFVTMASGEEAQAVIDKFDSQEVSGRIIRVEFAKRFKKHSPKPVPSTPVRVGGTRHQLYVSNLAWKVRGTHLREFFSAAFKPVSSKVVFDSPSGRSAGYGFVSFATREEAEAALSALDGKELMGRPLCLRLDEKRDDNSGSDKQEEGNSKSQAEDE